MYRITPFLWPNVAAASRSSQDEWNDDPTALTGSDLNPAQAFAISDDGKLEVVDKKWRSTIAVARQTRRKSSI